MSHGTFAWNELRTNDVEGAKTFYGETIGWTFEEMPLPEGTYWIAKFDDEPVAGIIDIAAVAPKAPRPIGSPISPSTMSTSASRRSR